MFPKIIENIIIIIILLAISQTFIDEFATYKHLDVETRKMLILSGFIFDLIFTIEFIARLILNARRKKAGIYLKYGRGWVDFMSSIPLLLLNSGPQMLFVYFGNNLAGAVAGIGVLNVLKVIKAIRITRILRLIRMLKIFGKIKNVNSKMTLHHTATTATIAITSVIMIILILNFIPPFSKMEDKYLAKTINQTENLLPFITSGGNVYNNLPEGVLSISIDNKTIYSRYSDDYIKKMFFADEIMVFSDIAYYNGSFKQVNIIITNIPYAKQSALQNMIYFSIILFIIIGFMIIYARHFAIYVSDVVYVINRGLSEDDYFLTVMIKEPYKDEEIFQLAKSYNDKWLPLKHRRKIILERKKMLKSKLTFEDFVRAKDTNRQTKQ